MGGISRNVLEPLTTQYRFSYGSLCTKRVKKYTGISLCSHCCVITNVVTVSCSIPTDIDRYTNQLRLSYETGIIVVGLIKIQLNSD